MEYVITWNGKEFGKASLSREGLYWRISCCCPMPCRIHLRTVTGERDLGICVPDGTGFGLITRIPIKLLGEGEMHFSAIRKKEVNGSFSVKLEPDKPFQHLSRLRSASLVIENGILRIAFAENPESGFTE